MTDVDILSALAEVAREELGCQAPIDPGSPLVEVLELDSIRTLTLLTAVEDRFRICLPPGEEAGVVTAADLVRLIRRQLDDAA
jgi:acyl carrier protein